jgi:hypothetical protein
MIPKVKQSRQLKLIKVAVDILLLLFLGRY